MDLGSFRTVRQLADGGLGPTYLAVEKAGSLQAVVKAISPEFLRQPEALSRLAALATALATPPAPGIVNLLGCTTHADGSALLAMPFLDAKNIAEIVAQKPGETPPDSMWIARDVAAMLAAGHRVGLRHLALRPSQVLVSVLKDSERGIAVHLLGLGLVEALGSHRPVGLTGRRQVYVAPEQQEAATGTPIDERTDVFGLGILLLHLLLGQQPSLEVVQKYRDEATKLLAGRVQSEDTARLIQTMLAVEPRGRPTLAEVLRILGKEIEGESRQANFASLPTQANKADGKIEAEDPAKGSLPPPEGRLFGNFRIIRCLGEGGMGVVYEAEHQQIGRRAAIKVLHPEYAQNAEYAKRFLNEARAVNIIRHPGLVEIFEYGQQPDGSLYIVMEFLQGESLLARLKKGRDTYSVAQIVGWATQIARALVATHAQGIMHRDLKPESIMLVPDPVRAEQDWVKILDFGIAKITNRATPETASQAKTGVGIVMGTPIYMAPEQLSSEDLVDSRADVFTFGVLLYEMLAGQRPYKVNSLRMDWPPEILTQSATLLSEGDHADHTRDSVVPASCLRFAVAVI